MNNIYSTHFWATTFVLFLLFSCEQNQKKKPIPADAALTQLAEGFSFTEGPTADSEGNIYFTDQPNNIIYRYSTTGVLDTLTHESGRANGLYIDKKDNLWACADLHHQLLKYALPSKSEKEIVLTSGLNFAFNGPNDVWVHTNGNVYFTDPYYERPYWQDVHDTLSVQGVYVLLDGEEFPILVDSVLIRPNGIVGDSERNVLYVADIGNDRIYQYRINSKGLLRDKELLISRGSDGMTLDNEGNIYLTGDCIEVFDSTGSKIQQLNVPQDWVSNVCFGGKTNNDLIITATEGLYKVKSNVKGVE